MRTTRSVIVWNVLTLVALLAPLTTPASAQLVADGQTNILSGVTNSVSGDLTVGTNGSNTTLVIGNRCLVSDNNAYVGYNPDANYNQVSVGGTNSRWNSSSSLIVGRYGAFNTLLITDGGKVSNSESWIGSAESGSNNQVIVTGTNSAWNNSSDMNVGSYGSFNSLLISGGAKVTNTVGTIGYSSYASNNQVTVNGSNTVWKNLSVSWIGVVVGWQGSLNGLLITNGGVVMSTVGFIGHEGGGDSNQVTVTGAGSLWTNSGNLQIGSNGTFNALLIADGGKVANANGYIGTGTYGITIPSAGNSNQVTVTGTDSLWTNKSQLFVGWFGAFNTLLISNGGTATATNVIVGANTSSINNRAIVDGGTLRVSNAVGTAPLDIRRGTNVLNAGLVEAGLLLLTNTQGLFEFNGGTLNVRTITVSNAQPFIVGNGSSVATFNVVGGRTNTFANGLLIQSNATLTGTGTINGSVTNCGTIFLTNADQMAFTGPVVNKGVILAVTGTPRFGSTFTNLGTLITTASINVANVSVSGPDIVLQFNSVSNYLHEVQASTNVTSGLWQTLTNGLLGTGSPITFTDPGGALSPNRTYRVLLH